MRILDADLIQLYQRSSKNREEGAPSWLATDSYDAVCDTALAYIALCERLRIELDDVLLLAAPWFPDIAIQGYRQTLALTPEAALKEKEGRGG